MIERYCAWHRPAPILLERIDDGKPEVLQTDGICRDCIREVERSWQLRQIRSAGGVSTSFTRRAPLFDELCYLVIGIPLAPVLVVLWAGAIIINILKVAVREAAARR